MERIGENWKENGARQNAAYKITERGGHTRLGFVALSLTGFLTPRMNCDIVVIVQLFMGLSQIQLLNSS
jgi:hypothetical protein